MSNNKKIGVLTPRLEYKPFKYQWAYDAWETQNKAMWFAKDTNMGEDIKDWNSTMTEDEKELIVFILKFFTQADIDVHECYGSKYKEIYKPIEIQMMLSAIENIETIHIDAYSYLNDTLNLPDSIYKEFVDFEEMKAKHDFGGTLTVDNPLETAITTATYGAFVEGLQLFSSFAILLNYSRFNKMKGVGQIVTYSVRDESLHAHCMIRLFKTLAKEAKLDMGIVKERLLKNCETCVNLELAFIKLVFSRVTSREILGLTEESLEKYIKFVANRRLFELGILKKGQKHYLEATENPFPWMDDLNGVEFADFFEMTPTEYTQSKTQGTWDEVEF